MLWDGHYVINVNASPTLLFCRILKSCDLTAGLKNDVQKITWLLAIHNAMLLNFNFYFVLLLQYVSKNWNKFTYSALIINFTTRGNNNSALY